MLRNVPNDVISFHLRTEIGAIELAIAHYEAALKIEKRIVPPPIDSRKILKYAVYQVDCLSNSSARPMI